MFRYKGLERGRCVVKSKGNPVTKQIKLFGHPIIPHRRLTVAQQIHKIFIEEIHAGRWQVGTRLPGVVSLSSQTGLGNQTIQRAFTLLKKDGYIQSEPSKGSFLCSLLPNGLDASSNRIGILMTDEQEQVPYTLWLSYLFMDAAIRHGFLGELKVVKADSDWIRVVKAGEVFSPGVKSIISLVPFDQRDEWDRPVDSLPVVFFCHMLDECAPSVALDVCHACYELTRHIVRAGYADIVFVEDTTMESHFTALFRKSYRRAMHESGLEIREYSCAREDKTQASQLLKELVGIGRVTAVLGGSLQLVEDAILPAVRKLNISVPEQLGIAALGSTKLPWDSALYSTGIELDFDYVARACFDLVKELVVTGSCHQTHILIKGKYLPGHTLLQMKAPKKPAKTRR